MRRMSHEEETDHKLLVDVQQEFAHWRWCQSLNIYLAIHQWVSSIYFLGSKVHFYTMITFLASLLEDIHKHTHSRACFHSTGRWFQMLPKRMKGREAPNRPALDSTKDLEAAQLEPPRLPYCFLRVVVPPRRSRTIFVIYLLWMCQTRGEAKGWRPLSLKTKLLDKKTVSGKSRRINKTKQRNLILENKYVLLSAHFIYVTLNWQTFLLLYPTGQNISHLGFKICSKDLLNISFGLSCHHRLLTHLVDVSRCY